MQAAVMGEEEAGIAVEKGGVTAASTEREMTSMLAECCCAHWTQMHVFCANFSSGMVDPCCC